MSPLQQTIQNQRRLVEIDNATRKEMNANILREEGPDGLVMVIDQYGSLEIRLPTLGTQRVQAQYVEFVAKQLALWCTDPIIHQGEQ